MRIVTVIYFYRDGLYTQKNKMIGFGSKLFTYETIDRKKSLKKFISNVKFSAFVRPQKQWYRVIQGFDELLHERQSGIDNIVHY